MATKKSYIAKPSDTVDFDEVMRRIDAVPTAKPAEQPTGFLRTQADRGLALGQGVVGGVKMLTDLAGADNSVSQSLGSANKSLQGMYSPERQAEMANRQKLIEAADAGDSTLDQITTRLGGVKEAPVQTVLQAVGSMAPPIIAGLATGGMTTGAGVMASAARMGIPAVVGGGMGVGAVKGQNYEAVYNKSISDGLPDLEAKALAVRASEYSAQNAPQQAIAAGLGAVAASTGAEKLISAMARKGVVAQAPQGMLRSGAKGAVTEALPEGAQGAQGQYAQNEALNNAGYQTSPYAGVVGAGVTDAVVGSMIGGPLGAVQRQPVATSGPLARAASTIAPGTAEAMNAQNAPPVDTTLGVDPADDPIMGRISQLPDGAREDAAKAYAVLNNPKAAKGIQLYNKKLLDRLLEQDLKANPAVDQSISNQSAINNIAQISSLQTERTDPETGEITQAYDQRQLDAPRQEDGDVLNAENKPFTNMLSAKRTAQALGDGFQPIKLGKNAYVVRAKGAEPGPEAVTEQPAEAAALDAAPTAIAEGNANLPGGDGELLQTSSTEPGAVSLNAVDDTNPAAGAQFKTKTQAAQTPKAGKADEAGTTAAGAQARSATVEGDGVGREGYEKPFTVDAKSLKAVIEKEAGVPDNLNLDKLEAVRNGAKSSGNIELAIKQGTGKGDIGVNDGRHRIAVAAERGEKITAFASDEDVIEIQSKLKAAVEGATVNTKAATAKLIPDMSDAELTALQDHYGPDHKRTPKLQKELEKRASNQAPTQSNQAQAAPENVAKSLNSPNSPNLVDAKQPPAAEVAPDFTKDLADGRAGLAELEKKRKLTRSSKRADIDGQITRLKATMAEMKTSQVESGIPLADETPDLAVQRAEAAKRETQRKAKASRLRGYTYDKSPFLAFLGKHGVALSRKADFSPDKNPMLSGYGPMFRNSGKNTDLLVQNAIEENFLPERATSDELENLISQQISGKRIEAIYSPEVANRVMNERMAEAQDAFQEELAVQQEAAQNADFDPFAPLGELDYAQEDADASGYSNAEQALQLKINALLLTAEKQGIDTQEIKDQAYDDTREGTTQDYLNAARAALKSAIEGSNGDSSQDAGKQGDAGSQSSQGLTAPTQQDVLDQQDRKNNTEALDQKEQIDREVSGQTLTSQAAPEQRTDTSGDMFEREKAEAEIAKRNVGRVQDSDPNQPTMFSRADVALVGPMSPSPSKTPLYEAFRQLSRFDKCFQLRDSASADLAQIATDMQAGRGKSLVFTADTDSTALHQGNRKPTISLRIPDANGVSQKLLDIFEADSERPFVVIGNSELGQKIDGAAAYQIAFAWAHNNGKTMRPDPAGLTVINRLRRTEAMVSSALHFGTTKHLEPHQDQYIALTKKALTDKKESEDTHYSGNPDVFNELEALKNKLWTKKTDADSIALNVQNLIEASAQLAALREPALRTFIVIDGTLRKRGVAAQIPLADVVADSKAGEVKIHGVVLRPASSGVGSSTLKRYAVAASTGRAVQQANAGSVQRIDGKDGSVGSTPDIAALRAIRAVLGDFSGKTSGELDGVLYSRNAGNPQAVQSTAEVEKITTGITSRWANAPEVVVVYDMQDPRIPAKVRAQDLEQRSGGATGDPEGFFLGGKVYILASQVSTPKDVARVLFHESLGHYGLRGVFGEQLKPILQQLAGLRKPMVEAKAKQYGLDMKDESQRLQAAEEVLAEMAQTRLELGFVKRAIAIIRSWLRRNLPGFKNMALTDADIIANYIIPARGWVERGQSSNEGGMVPAFSRGTNDVVTNPKDVVGNQGGRSADDTTPGAAFDAQAAFERHGGTNDVDESTDITAKSQAFADMAEAAGYTVVGRGDKYVVVKKDFGKDADGYEQEAAIKVRISDHSNVNRGYHFGDTDINIAPDDGYSRDTFYDALRKLQAAYVDSDGNTVIPNEPTAPDSGGAPMFSRTLTSALNNTQDLKLPAGYIVNDFFKGDGKLSWWHKTIGTQYNLAQRNPQFKPVFDGVQNFINDVSFYATKAADRAPSILPKLESWNDIAKSPLSAADNKAIAAPIFEGTLTWSRDEDGKPVKASDIQAKATKMSAADKAQRLFREGKINESLLKMWQGLPVEQFEKIIGGKYASEFLKAGIVFTPAELKSLFNLTDAQVALYSEFRAATDKSLTDLAVADMIRFGGDDVASIKDVALDAGDVDAAAVMLRDHLLEMADGSARSDVLIDTANKMIDKADRARDLMNRGYAPLSRFGSYSLDVLDETGGRVYFGLFESKAEANKMARQMRANFPQGTISQGTMSDEEYKLFAGVSPETVELFGEMLGLESGQDGAANQAFQQYLKLAKANRSAIKRLIERKGIAGFSEDPGRVLAGFVYSNARQTSSGLHMGGIAQAVSDIPKGQGELKDAAMRLTEYIKNPQEEAQAIRGLLFAQYLGGSIASAIVNMTQPMNVTFPWLSQYGGVMKAAGQMKNAMRDALKKDTGDTALDAALKKAEEDGIVSPQEVFQLMAQAQGKSTLKSGDGTTAGDALAKGSNALSKLSLAWGKVFGVAEQFNRRTTFIAAYRTAIDQKLGDPAAFAEKAVNETQFVYGKGSKPRWARGAVGGTLFTFKSYSINYVELLSRMAANGPEGKKAALLAVGMLFMMAGSGGLPFADDLDDVVDGLLQRMGYNFSSKRAKQEFFINLLGKDGAQFVERGISGLAGVPIDLSGRLGMGNLIPGTGLLTKKDNYTRDLTELLGPAGDLAKRTFEATGKLVDGNVLSRTGAMATMSPVATRNVIQAMDMANTGMYRDATGKKIIDTDSYDAFAKGIGFQPNDVARVQSATRQVQNMIAQSKLREKEIADSWALGIFEKDDDKVQAARDSLKRWNESNPDAKIVIAMPQIIKRVRAMREDKTTRIAKTAPKEIRATVRRELEGER